MTPSRGPAVAYAPGDWVLLVHGTTVVVLPPDAIDVAPAVWTGLGRTDGLAAVLRFLSGALGGDLLGLPAFAVLHTDDDAVHVVVRGALTVRRGGDTDDDGAGTGETGGTSDPATGPRASGAAEVVAGADALTWAERRLTRGGRFRIDLPAVESGPADAAAGRTPGSPVPSPDWRLLVDGAALTGAVRLEDPAGGHDVTSAAVPVSEHPAGGDDATPAVGTAAASAEAVPAAASCADRPVSAETIGALPTGEQPEAPAAGSGSTPHRGAVENSPPGDGADTAGMPGAPVARPRTLIDAVPWRLDGTRFPDPSSPAPSARPATEAVPGASADRIPPRLESPATGSSAAGPSTSTMPPGSAAPDAGPPRPAGRESVDPGATPGTAPSPSTSAPSTSAPSTPTPSTPPPSAPPPTLPPVAVDAAEDHDGLTLTGAQQQALRTARQVAPGGPRAVFATGDVIPLDGITVLGRRPAVPVGADPTAVRLVTVPSPQSDISRSHLRIERLDDGWRATDLHSTNGTVLTHPGEPARRLQSGASLPLHSGDGIDLGDGVTATLADLA